jgi:hypothetical protein
LTCQKPSALDSRERTHHASHRDEAAEENATYDDLREIPDHFVAEMLDGDLYASPRPEIPHTRAASVLGAALPARSTKAATALVGG